MKVITKYESLDGVIHDNKLDAENADEVWLRSREGLNLVGRISNLVGEAEKFYRSVKSFPIVVIFHEKYGDAQVIALDEEGLLEAFWFKFKERMTYFYSDDDILKKVCEEIKSTENKMAALGVMLSRAHYEYEEWSLSIPTFYGKLLKQP